MKCEKCSGRGWYENPRYPNPASYSWAGEPSFKCKKCRGTGYIIGEVRDVLDFLQHLKVKFELEKDREYLRSVNQCIEAIENQ